MRRLNLFGTRAEHPFARAREPAAPFRAAGRRTTVRRRPGAWRPVYAAQASATRHCEYAAPTEGAALPGKDRDTAFVSIDASALVAAVATVVRELIGAPPADPDILSVADISAALRCSEDTVRRIPPSDLPVHRVGKVNLYFREDMLRYVRSRRVSKARGHTFGEDRESVDEWLDGLLSSEPGDVRKPSSRRAG